MSWGLIWGVSNTELLLEAEAGLCCEGGWGQGWVWSPESPPYKPCTLPMAIAELCCVLQELNVRVLTLSADKARYGVRLRAEPEHTVLGRRLKGAFKPLMAAIKELSSEQLERFQETGQYWDRPLRGGRVSCGLWGA